MEHTAREWVPEYASGGWARSAEDVSDVPPSTSPEPCVVHSMYAFTEVISLPPGAPRDAFILGLKELPQTKDALLHRHIIFRHAYKGQHAGQALLNRFKAGGGLLLDLEYLVDTKNRRVAAFGYWAGYAGAAVALKCWAAQKCGQICQGLKAYPNNQALLDDLRNTLSGVKVASPTGLVIGALGRVGTG